MIYHIDISCIWHFFLPFLQLFLLSHKNALFIHKGFPGICFPSFYAYDIPFLSHHLRRWFLCVTYHLTYKNTDVSVCLAQRIKKVHISLTGETDAFFYLYYLQFISKYEKKFKLAMITN